MFATYGYAGAFAQSARPQPFLKNWGNSASNRYISTASDSSVHRGNSISSTESKKIFGLLPSKLSSPLVIPWYSECNWMHVRIVRRGSSNSVGGSRGIEPGLPIAIFSRTSEFRADRSRHPKPNDHEEDLCVGMRVISLSLPPLRPRLQVGHS